MNAEKVVWATLAKVCDKESDRKQLLAGDSHLVHLQVSGNVDGNPVERVITANVDVGEDFEKAASHAPNKGIICALIKMLKPEQRELALQHLQVLAEKHAGSMPDPDENILLQVDSMLSNIRAMKTVSSKGAVRVNYKCYDPVDALLKEESLVQ